MEKKIRRTFEEKRDESVSRIMNAAMEVFAESGFSGARVDEIAKKAGVNKAMIYYRIGNKNTLYTEVLHRVFGDTGENMARNICDTEDPEEMIRRYIQNLSMTVKLNPCLPNIMMREIAWGMGNVNESVVKDIAGIIGILTEILDRGVERGIFVETDPFLLHLMVIGVIILFNASRPIRMKYSPLFSDRIKSLSKNSHNDIVNEIERLVLRALKT